MRLLVIVSGDYGELSVAKYFLGGLQIAPMPVMLVPAGLRQPEGVEAGVDVRTYDELADIVRVVEETDPDTVLLFSGYLLTIGRRFSLLKAFLLFRLLRRRGARIITSDPFIGLIRSPWSLRFREMLRLRKKRGPGLAASILAPLFAIRTYLIHLQLRRDWHLYPAPVAHRFLAPGHRGRSFFNGSAALAAADMAAGTDATPTWLFVLSQVDFRYQTNRRGEAFVGHVAARLCDAARLGRRVVMIGPADLLEDLRRRIGDGSGIELRGIASHSEYMRYLMRAERVFVWNYYSSSVLHRVLANRPVHYFDEGHMVSILPELEQVGIDTFYGGWRPPLLRVEEPFDERQLDRLAQETRENFARIKARMAGGLSPRALLEAAGACDGPPLSG